MHCTVGRGKSGSPQQADGSEAKTEGLAANRTRGWSISYSTRGFVPERPDLPLIDKANFDLKTAVFANNIYMFINPPLSTICLFDMLLWYEASPLSTLTTQGSPQHHISASSGDIRAACRPAAMIS